MQILQLAKNPDGISLYVEEAALLFTTFALFTSFLWKYMQILNKRVRDKESAHAWFSKTVENLQLLMVVSEILDVSEYHILHKQDSEKQICNILV